MQLRVDERWRRFGGWHKKREQETFFPSSAPLHRCSWIRFQISSLMNIWDVIWIFSLFFFIRFNVKSSKSIFLSFLHSQHTTGGFVRESGAELHQNKFEFGIYSFPTLSFEHFSPVRTYTVRKFSGLSESLDGSDEINIKETQNIPRNWRRDREKSRTKCVPFEN